MMGNVITNHLLLFMTYIYIVINREYHLYSFIFIFIFVLVFVFVFIFHSQFYEFTVKKYDIVVISSIANASRVHQTNHVLATAVGNCVLATAVGNCGTAVGNCKVVYIVYVRTEANPFADPRFPENQYQVNMASLAGSGFAEAYVLKKLHQEKMKRMEGAELEEKTRKMGTIDSTANKSGGCFVWLSRNKHRKIARVMNTDETEAAAAGDFVKPN